MIRNGREQEWDGRVQTAVDQWCVQSNDEDMVRVLLPILVSLQFIRNRGVHRVARGVLAIDR